MRNMYINNIEPTLWKPQRRIGFLSTTTVVSQNCCSVFVVLLLSLPDIPIRLCAASPILVLQLVRLQHCCCVSLLCSTLAQLLSAFHVLFRLYPKLTAHTKHPHHLCVPVFHFRFQQRHRRLCVSCHPVVCFQKSPRLFCHLLLLLLLSLFSLDLVCCASCCACCSFSWWWLCHHSVTTNLCLQNLLFSILFNSSNRVCRFSCQSFAGNV